MFVKYGFVKQKQKFKCKECKKVFQEGDRRVKHSIGVKLKVLKMYLEGVGIRSIERLENVSSPLIIRWIREFDKIIQTKLKELEIPKDKQDIVIIEVDELVTHIKKNEIRSGYGLLSTGIQTKFWILK